MELDIAALSMNMAAANLQQGVSIGMMKKTMESTSRPWRPSPICWTACLPLTERVLCSMSEHDGQTWAAQKWAVFF